MKRAFYPIQNSQLLRFLFCCLLAITISSNSNLAQIECNQISLFDLNGVAGFPAIDSLVVCGAPDTLAILVSTPSDVLLTDLELTIPLPTGIQYAGFESALYPGTSIVPFDVSDPQNPVFTINDVDETLQTVIYIGVEANCDITFLPQEDKNNLAYGLEITYTHPTLGSCYDAYYPFVGFSNGLIEPILNIINVTPLSLTITDFGIPIVRTITISQDGIDAILENFTFVINNIYLDAGLQITNMTANGIPLTFAHDPVTMELTAFIDGTIYFPGNFDPLGNPPDIYFDENEQITIDIEFTLVACPDVLDASWIHFIGAFYDCHGQECERPTGQNAGLTIDLNLAPPVVDMTVNMSSSPEYCTPGQLDITITNSSPTPVAGDIYDLQFCIDFCDDERDFDGNGGGTHASITFENLTIGGAVLPLSNYGTTNNPPFNSGVREHCFQINNGFATDPDVNGLSDIDGDGFFDDLLAGETVTGTVDIVYNCTDLCEVNLDCVVTDYHLYGLRSCRTDTLDRDFTTNIPFQHQNVSNDFGITGAGGDNYHMDQDYEYTALNITPCSNYNAYWEVTFYGPNIILTNGNFVIDQNSVTFNGTPVPLADQTLTISGDTLTLVVNAGSELLDQLHEYDLDYFWTCTDDVPDAMTVESEVYFECTDCECVHVRACGGGPINLGCDPAPGNNCVFAMSGSLIRTSYGFTDATMTTQATQADICPADLTRFTDCDQGNLVVCGEALQSFNFSSLEFRMTSAHTGGGGSADVLFTVDAINEVRYYDASAGSWIVSTCTPSPPFSSPLGTAGIDLTACIPDFPSIVDIGDSICIDVDFTLFSRNFQSNNDRHIDAVFYSNADQGNCPGVDLDYSMGTYTTIVDSEVSYTDCTASVDITYTTGVLHTELNDTDPSTWFSCEYRPFVEPDNTQWVFHNNLGNWTGQPNIYVDLIPGSYYYIFNGNNIPINTVNLVHQYNSFTPLPGIPTPPANTDFIFEFTDPSFQPVLSLDPNDEIMLHFEVFLACGEINRFGLFDVDYYSNLCDIFCDGFDDTGSFSDNVCDRIRLIENDPVYLNERPNSGELTSTITDQVINSNSSMITNTMEVCAEDNDPPVFYADHHNVTVVVHVPINTTLLTVVDQGTGTSYPFSQIATGSPGAPDQYLVHLPDLVPGACITLDVTTDLNYCTDETSYVGLVASSGCADFDTRMENSQTIAIGSFFDPQTGTFILYGETAAGCRSTAEFYTFNVNETEIQAELTTQPVPPVNLCDTMDYCIRIKNVKEGYAYDAVLSLFFPPAGFSFVPGSFTYQYPGGPTNFGTPTPTFADPTFDAAGSSGFGNLYTLDIADIDTWLATNGIPGILDYNSTVTDSNKLIICFRAVTECDSFISGSPFVVDVDATDACNEPESAFVEVSNPVVVDGADPMDYSQFVVFAEPENVYCGLDNRIYVTAINLSENLTDNSTESCITFPTGVDYIAGSFQFESPTSFVPTVTTGTNSAGLVQVCTDIPPGLGLLDFFTYSFEITQDQLECGEVQLAIDITTQVNDITCSSTGQPCSAFVQNNINPFTSFNISPAIDVLSLANVEISCDVNGEDQLHFEADIYNPGPDIMNGNFTIDVFEDTNQNGVLDNGVDLNIISDATILNIDSADIITLVGDYTINLPHRACELLIQIETDASCVCTSVPLYVEDIPYTNWISAPDSVALCPDESVQWNVCGDIDDFSYIPFLNWNVIGSNPPNFASFIDTTAFPTISFTMPCVDFFTPIFIEITKDRGDCDVSDTIRIDPKPYVKIEEVLVGECVYDDATGLSTNELTVTISWLMDHTQDSISLSIPGQSQIFSPSFSAGTTSLTFTVPADFTSGNPIDAAFVVNPDCIDQAFYDSTFPCDPLACTLDIITVNFADCVFDPVGYTSTTDVTIEVDWTNAPPGEMITVEIQSQTQQIDPALGAPQSVIFTIDANGTLGNLLSAYFETTVGCREDIIYNNLPNCFPECSLAIDTVMVGVCNYNAATGESEVTVDVEVSWVYPPSGEMIEVIIGTQVWYIDPLTSTSPQTATFSLIADGSTGNSVLAQFETTTDCFAQGSFDLPDPCGPCEINITAITPYGCISPLSLPGQPPASPHFDLDVEISWSNAPPGELIEVTVNGTTLTIDPAALTSPQTVTFNDLPADGVTIYTILAEFETTTTCTITEQITAMEPCPFNSCHLSIYDVEVSDCDAGNAIIEVFFAWGLAFGASDQIDVTFDGNTYTVPSIITGSGSSSITFSVPADGSSGNEIIAFFQGDTNCADTTYIDLPPQCNPCNLSIDQITVGDCFYDVVPPDSGNSLVQVDVEVSWTGAPAGDFIVVDINGEIRIINASIVSSPQTVTVYLPATGGTGLPIDAFFSSVPGCADSGLFDLPPPCPPVVCELIIVSATPSICTYDPATGTSTFDLDVEVTYMDDPGGDININGSLFPTDGSGNQTFTITGLTADGSAGNALTAFFVNDQACMDATTYDAPAECPVCALTITELVPGPCVFDDVAGTSTFDLDVTVTYANGPAGDIDIDGNLFTPDGSGNETFTITGLTADGSTANQVIAFFVNDVLCTDTLTYDAPAACPLCNLTITALAPQACQYDDVTGASTFDLDVTIAYSSEPTGDIDINGTTFTPDGSGNETFTLTGLTASGPSVDQVIALFLNDVGCTDTLTYDVPPPCPNCSLSIDNITLGPCQYDSATGTSTFDLDVEVTYSNPPTGDIDIDGNLFTPDGSGNETFTLTGLTADGSSGVQLIAFFVDDVLCTDTLTYDVPYPCPNCSLSIDNITPGQCQYDAATGTSTFDLDVEVTYANPPTGDIDINGSLFTPDGSGSETFTLTGLPADGSTGNLVTAFFVNDALCSDTLSYDAPAECGPTCSLSVVSLTPGPCNFDPNTGASTFDLDVEINYTDEPGGDIDINGTLFTPDGSGNETFTLTGLVADGSTSNPLIAFFVNDTTCVDTSAYNAPLPCGVNCAMAIIALTPGPCQYDTISGLSTFDLDIQIDYTNEPTGDIDINGNLFTPDGSGSETFTLSGLPADGSSSNSISAFFVNDTACNDTASYDAPAPCAPEFDLALQKQLAAGQASTVSPGDSVTFTITIYNQGDIDAVDIEITDYIPAGLTLADGNWTDNTDGTATYNSLLALLSGGSTQIDITFTVDNGVNGPLVNYAEISDHDDDGDPATPPPTDIDSTPDNDDSNDAGGTPGGPDDDHVDGDGTGTPQDGNDTTDEDDHDPAQIDVTPCEQVAGVVFLDADNDGCQADAADGVSGVTVELFSCNADGTLTSVGTTTTAADGSYEFGPTPEGGDLCLSDTITYQVQISNLPAGYTNSTGAGTGCHGDDDDSPANDGTSDCYNPDDTDTGDDDDDEHIDFGIVPPPDCEQVAGVVFVDADNDGCQADAADGVSGVTVELFSCNADGTLTSVGTTTTAADGSYEFGPTAAGGALCLSDTITYQVQISNLPAGYTNSTGAGTGCHGDDDDSPANDGTSDCYNPDDTDTGDDDDDEHIDFGIIPPPDCEQVAGVVFVDADNDGCQADAADGVSGVTVELFSCNGDGTLTSVGTTTTAADGSYEFGPTAAGGALCLSDTITYQVQISGLPAGYTNSTGAGTGCHGDDDDSPANDGTSDCYNPDDTDPEDDDDDEHIDFGIVPPPDCDQLGGTVFVDADNDGCQADAADGVSGVTVELFSCNADGTLTSVGTTTTAADGSYEFGPTPEGGNLCLSDTITYQVQISGLPAGYSNSTGAGTGCDGDNDNSPANDGTSDCYNPDDTDPEDDDDDEHIDFGIVPPPDCEQLGGTVFVDADNDGCQADAADGVSGVTVELFSCNADGTLTSVGTTTTAADGSYEFGPTPEGGNLCLSDTITYQVQISGLPAGYSNSTGAGTGCDGDNDNSPANDGTSDCYNPNDTDPEDDDDDEHIDFGIVPPPDCEQLGGTVFVDADNDGCQADAADGLAGVTVELFSCNADGTLTSVGTTTTAADGSYEFGPTPEGGNLCLSDTITYQVQISGLPAGYSNSTGAGTGCDGNNDNSPGNDGISDCYNPDDNDNDDGDDDEHIDFGVVPEIFDLALQKQLAAGQSAVVNPTDSVTFTITVYNQGNVSAVNIELTDYMPAGLTLADSDWTDNTDGTATFNSLISLIPGASMQIDITFTVDAGVSGNLVNYAEISDHDDDGDPNTPPPTDVDSTPDTDDSNDAGGTPGGADDDYVDGDGSGNPLDGNDSTDEDDQDPAVISVQPPGVFDLALRKTVAVLSDSPLIPGTSSVTFAIEIFNQGTVDAVDIEITDYLPAGLTLNDPNWINNGDGTATYNSLLSLVSGASTTITIMFDVDADASGTIDNYAEISNHDDDGDPNTPPPTDIDSTPDNDNSDDLVDDEIFDDGTTDEDDHDIASVDIPEPGIFDLALIKMLQLGQSSVVGIGDTVHYEIVVTNQGTMAATNVSLMDFLPAGLDLADPSWTDNGDGTASYMFSGPLLPGQSIIIPIMMIVNGTELGDLTNWAEITEAFDLEGTPGDDIDSNPDGDQGNDVFITDNVNNGNGSIGEDEDDHDPAVITVDELANVDIFDLALIKQLAPGESNIVSPGDLVTYTITVYNQGDIDAANVTIADYLPAGMTLADSDWTDNGDGTASYNIPGIIPVGGLVQVSVTVEVGGVGEGALINFAEITHATDPDNNPQTDIDSTPDSNQDNDGPYTDNEIDNGNNDEDDHDPEIVTMFIPPTDCDTPLPCPGMEVCTGPMQAVTICPESCNITGDYTIDYAETSYHCSVQIVDGCIIYTPLPGMEAIGQDVITINITGENGECYLLLVTVTIGDCNPTDPCLTPTVCPPIDVCTEPLTPIDICPQGCGATAPITIVDAHSMYQCGIVNTGSCIIYTPLPGMEALGNDYVTIEYIDSEGNCFVQQVNVQIGGCAPAPCTTPIVCPPISICTEPLTSIDICPSGCGAVGNITITGMESMYHCSLVNTGSCVRYTPLPGMENLGYDHVAISYTDAQGNCFVQQVNVQIGGCTPPPPPCETTQHLCTNPMTPIEICVNFCDPSMSIADAHTIYQCSITMLSGNCFRYTPLPGFDGQDVIEVTGLNPNGATETVIIIVDVRENCNGPQCPPAGTPCNDGNPNTVNDIADGNCGCYGTPLPPPCPAYGTPCNDGNPNTVNDIADGNCGCYGTPLPPPCPAYGTPCNDGNPNTVNDIADGNCGCYGTPIPPQPTIVANDDVYSTNDDQGLILDVLGNDQYSGCTPTITALNQPQSGTVLTNADGTFSYIPQVGFEGTVNFTYQLCCGGSCDVATVTIHVTLHEPCDLGSIQVGGKMSPNGDGINDALTIDCDSSCFEDYEVQVTVFNRWGEEVYHEENYTHERAWNGTYQNDGTDLPNGTYFYIIQFIGDELNTINGSVELRK